MNGNGDSSGMVKPYAVGNVFFHERVHLDEIEAFRLARTFGEKPDLLPGISKAGIRFSKNLPPRTDEVWKQLKVLPIGCGKGWCDEHKGKRGRLPNTSATTLMADFLGVRNEPILKPLIDEVLACDARAGVRPTQLAELVKICHRRMDKGGQMAVLNWATQGLEAIHRQLAFQYAAVDGERTLGDLFEDLKKDGHYAGTDPRVLESVGREIARSMENRDQRLTELSNICSCLYRTGAVPVADVVDWVMFALDKLVEDQEVFRKALDECKGAKGDTSLPGIIKKEIPFRLDGHDSSLRALFVHSDNPHMGKASRHRSVGAQVAVVRKTSGHVAVFIDSRIRGLNLANLVRMFRWLELEKTGQEGDRERRPKSPCDWHALAQPAEYEGSALYYFKGDDGEAALNGSDTHPGIPATEIASEAILEIVCCAFHPRSVAEWIWRRNIVPPERHRDERRNVSRSRLNTVLPELEVALDAANKKTAEAAPPSVPPEVTQ